MNAKNFKRFLKEFKAQVLDSHTRLGNETAIVQRDAIVEICTWLRDDEKMRFDMLTDITVVDYLNRKPRFEVVYQLYSTVHKHRVRLRAPIEQGDESIATVTGVWKAANWGEREAWDMFGIVFRGHPDLRRMLMYEEFEGHPLRKDYPIQQSQPRMDLRAAERDAVQEYKALWRDRRDAADTSEAR